MVHFCNTVPSNKFGIRVGCDLYILSSNGWYNVLSKVIAVPLKIACYQPHNKTTAYSNSEFI
jgi:hypothetical protein